MAEHGPRAFVCGHPVAHSRSPLIHGHWLAELELAGSYERLDVSPEGFPGFLRGLPSSGFVGGNVTIPHKEAAWHGVDRRDAAAERIGAVNTLWLEESRIMGGNTDAYGFAASLDQSAPGWRDAGVATVLGAGGAARAVIHALKEAGIPDIRIVNRTAGRATELAERFGGKMTVHEWHALDSTIDGTDLLVNTTPLGMAGAASMDVDVARLPDSAIVTDIVYVPLETPLLRAAADHGLRTVDGLGMLLHQAVAGFERWFGRTPEVSATLRERVIADLGRAH